MKAIVPLKNCSIEVEAETQKDLFQQMASAHEVFGEQKCGLCGSANIAPAWRTVTQGKKVYDYPEYHCHGFVKDEKTGKNARCGARLSLGSMMEGGVLFPMRKLVEEGPEKGKPDREKGKFGSHNGWTRFKGVKES